MKRFQESAHPHPLEILDISCVLLEQWFSNQGQFCAPTPGDIWQHVEMLLVPNWGVGVVGIWCSEAINAVIHPTMQYIYIYLAQKVTNSRLRKPVLE